ncbi:hypothetical protein GCM10010193_67620 [Kitasatospora atroaurantiaca]
MPEQSGPRTLQSFGAPLDASQIPYEGPGCAPWPPPHEYGVPISPQALLTAVLAWEAPPEASTPQAGWVRAGPARERKTNN